MPVVPNISPPKFCSELRHINLFSKSQGEADNKHWRGIHQLAKGQAVCNAYREKSKKEAPIQGLVMRYML